LIGHSAYYAAVAEC